MLAINGSIARSGDEVKIRGAVRPTLELFVSDQAVRLSRRKDEETGLWLLSL